MFGKIILRLAAACALLPSASLGAAPQNTSIRQGDLVVLGYVSPRSYEALDEFGMSAMITAELRISKVLRGRPPSRALKIRYIARMDLPEDSELRFHLRRSPSGSAWIVCKQGGGQGYICK